jgi:UDP-glucose 4-epimerase
VNETINLAYGQGNTLVRVAELIGGAVGVPPRITLAPALLGEVTRYVADVRKAQDLLGYTPGVPLDEGIPHAVAWFRAWRAAHPDENKPFVEDSTRSPQDAELGYKTVNSEQ